MGIFQRLFSPPKPIPKLGRNEPCWCGSGKKYKNCHMAKDEKKRARARAAACIGGS